MLKNSVCLSNVITNSSKTTEHGLITDLAAYQEAYSKMKIDSIGFLLATENVTNAFTKTMENKEVSSIMDEGQLTTSISQWIVRNKLQFSEYLLDHKYSSTIPTQITKPTITPNLTKNKR